ncbi:unnamed protein product [Sympodiomycopsis kandeliae]
MHTEIVTSYICDRLSKMRSASLVQSWQLVLLVAISTALLLLTSPCEAQAENAQEDIAQTRPEPVNSFSWPKIGLKPNVNLLPLAKALGLTTKPMGSETQQNILGQQGRDRYNDGAVYRSIDREELTLMTFNVRYDNPLARRKPSIPGQDTTFPSQEFGEVSWSTRRHFISDTILLHNPDIFIFQEVLSNQLTDLIHLLGPDYSFIGVGRNDGKLKGESVPVFWRNDKFQLINEELGGVGEKGYEHFWLSDHPEKIGSVGWDADQTRMCTHVALRYRNDPKAQPIHVFSTHYDHLGHVARAKSSELVLSRVNKVRRSIKQRLQDQDIEPLILLGGDLNSPREERGWQNLVHGHHGVPKSSDTKADDVSFIDLQLALPTRFGLPYARDHFPLKPEDGLENNIQKRSTRQQQPFKSPPGEDLRGIMSTLYGPATSFTDWNPPPRPREASEDRIDFWFMGDNLHNQWKVKAAGILSNWNQLEGGWRASDHRPVIVRLRRELQEEI